MYIGYRKNKLTNDVNLNYRGFEICNQLRSDLFHFILYAYVLYFESLN